MEPIVTLQDQQEVLLKGVPAAEVIREAREWLSDRSRWCQYAIACRLLESATADANLDVSGSNVCRPLDSRAAQWSIIGSVARLCEHGIVPIKLIQFLDHMAEERGAEDVDHFNDSTNHEGMLVFLADVIKVLDS